MGMWGGGGAGGWSGGIGGQGTPGRRNVDGWQDEYIGKAYDQEVVRRLLPYLKDYKLPVGIAMACMIVRAVARDITPLLIGLTIAAGATGNETAVWWLLGAMLGAALITGVAMYIEQLCTAWVGTQLLMRLRGDMYNHIQSLHLGFYDEMEVGRIISRLTSDVTVMQELLTSGSLTFIADIVGLVVVVISLSFVDLTLALITFAVAIPLAASMYYWQTHARKAFIDVRVKVSALYGTLAEDMAGVKTVQSMNREKENTRRFRFLNRENERANVWAGMLTAFIVPAVELAVAIALCAVLIVGGFKVLDSNDPEQIALLVGGLATFSVAVLRFFDPIRDLVMQYAMLQRAMAGGQRAFQVLDTKPRIVDKPDAIELDHVEGRVEFDHVSFSYSPDVPVLKDISFVAEPGETIALVGHTGAGKTSITSLISRGYEVTAGAIRVDGHDIRDIKRRSLTRHMGVVLQDPYLFSGTVRENITYGREDVTQEEIEAAAKAVGADEFINRLDHGYDTLLTQRAQNLSIGQRQLISFARAIVAQPRILILDEATAHVDTQTEVVIQRALRALLKDRTSFVIAHRLSTIREATRIIVLDKGEIAEVGTHEALLEREGIYASLYRLAYEQERQQDAADALGEDAAVIARARAELGNSPAGGGD